MIRNDLYEKMNQVYYETVHRELKHGDCYRLLKFVLKPGNDMPRKIYKKMLENWEKEEQAPEIREYARGLAKDILIRSDLYEKINKLYYEAEHRNLEYGNSYRLVQCGLKSEDSLQRKVYIKTQEKIDKLRIEYSRAEKSRKSLFLTAKDIEWNPLYMDNLLYNPLMGTYAFLFKNRMEGMLCGQRNLGLMILKI